MKAGHAVGLRWAAAGLPGVETDVVVIAPGRDEEKIAGGAPPRYVARLSDDVEAEDVHVEPSNPIDVGRAQVNMANSDARVDWIPSTGDRLDVSLSATHRHESPLSITRDGSLIRRSRDLHERAEDGIKVVMEFAQA